MKRLSTLLFAFSVAICFRAEADSSTPEAVTKAAYHTEFEHFGFSADTIRHEKPYLTPELYVALLAKANQPVAKGDAPDIEGDVLFDAQDVPEKYQVGYSYDGYANPGKADVPVQLRFGGKERLYHVHLIQINGAWKITDIDYGKDGKLTDLLK